MKMKRTHKILFMLLVLVLAVSNVTPTQEETVKLNKTKVTMYVGDSTTLKLTGTTKKVTWSTSDAKIATVKSGKVTAKKKGIVTITAKSGNKRYTCKVIVKNVILRVNDSLVYLAVGSTDTIKVTTSANKVIWKSSDSSVVAVTGKGKSAKITAKKRGNAGGATITVQAGNVKEYISVAVLEPVGYDEYTFDEKVNGYTNFIDMIKDYDPKKEKYKEDHVLQVTCDKSTDPKLNRGIKIGSSNKELCKAYYESFKDLGTWGEYDAWYTVDYIEPKTGFHFYKCFVLNKTGDSVTDIIWRYYLPSN